jgi:hypothetical protein
MSFPFPSFVATGVRPELNLVSVVAVLALLALSIWFLVISHDVATSFRRFRKLDDTRSAGASPPLRGATDGRTQDHRARVQV